MVYIFALFLWVTAVFIVFTDGGTMQWSIHFIAACIGSILAELKR